MDSKLSPEVLAIIAAEEADSRKQVVARIMNRDVTRGELSAAFDRVANETHWKLPIDARIPIASDFELEVLREAVVFFAGCRPTFTPLYVRKGSAGAVYHVEAVGYFAAIGA